MDLFLYFLTGCIRSLGWSLTTLPIVWMVSKEKPIKRILWFYVCTVAISLYYWAGIWDTVGFDFRWFEGSWSIIWPHLLFHLLDGLLILLYYVKVVKKKPADPKSDGDESHT